MGGGGQSEWESDEGREQKKECRDVSGGGRRGGGGRKIPKTLDPGACL